jgi:hypothetical protein
VQGGSPKKQWQERKNQGIGSDGGNNNPRLINCGNPILSLII